MSDTPTEWNIASIDRTAIARLRAHGNAWSFIEKRRPQVYEIVIETRRYLINQKAYSIRTLVRVAGLTISEHFVRAFVTIDQLNELQWIREAMVHEVIEWRLTQPSIKP